MNDIDKKLIIDFAFKRIDEKKFVSNFSYDLQDKQKLLSDFLQNSYDLEDAEGIELSLLFGFSYGIFGLQHVSILCKILYQDWHYKHEDIVGIMQDLKDDRCVDILYKTANRKFDYLNYDDSLGLARKCTWALHDIGTPQALSFLEKLAHSENETIANYAKKRLK